MAQIAHPEPGISIAPGISPPAPPEGEGEPRRDAVDFFEAPDAANWTCSPFRSERPSDGGTRMKPAQGGMDKGQGAQIRRWLVCRQRCTRAKGGWIAGCQRIPRQGRRAVKWVRKRKGAGGRAAAHHDGRLKRQHEAAVACFDKKRSPRRS